MFVVCWGQTYVNNWCTGLIVADFNILQGSASALTLHAQGLEDSFLGRPLACEACLRIGGLLAVCDLLLSEVALDERVVLDVDCTDALNVHTNLRVR